MIQTVATDAWAKTKVGIVRLLGRGDERTARAVDAHLTQTQVELTRLSGNDLERARRTEQAAWQDRFEQLLGRHPDAVVELWQLLHELHSQPRPPHDEHDASINTVAFGQAHVSVLGRGTQINHFGPGVSSHDTPGESAAPAD